MHRAVLVFLYLLVGCDPQPSRSYHPPVSPAATSSGTSNSSKSDDDADAVWRRIEQAAARHDGAAVQIAALDLAAAAGDRARDFTKYADSADPMIRLAVARFVGARGHRADAADLCLITLIADEDIAVQTAAVRAMVSAMSPATAAPVLAEAAQGTFGLDVASDAAIALGEIGAISEERAVALAVTAKQRAKLAAEQGRRPARVVSKPKGVLPPLPKPKTPEEIRKEQEESERRQAEAEKREAAKKTAEEKAAVEAAVKGLASSSPETRRRACKTLGDSEGGREHLEALKKLAVSDPNEFVQKAANEAVAKLQRK